MSYIKFDYAQLRLFQEENLRFIIKRISLSLQVGGLGQTEKFLKMQDMFLTA